MEANLQHPIACKDGVYDDLGTSETAQLFLHEAVAYCAEDTKLFPLWKRACNAGMAEKILMKAHEHVYEKFPDTFTGALFKWATASFLAGLLIGKNVNSQNFWEPMLLENNFYVPNLFVASMAMDFRAAALRLSQS